MTTHGSAPVWWSRRCCSGSRSVLLRRTDWTPVGGDPFAGVEIPRDPFADVPDP